MEKYVSLNGLPALRAYAGLILDPLGTTRKLVGEHGPFLKLRASRRFEKHRSTLHLARADLAEAVLKNHTTFHNGGIIVHGKSGSRHNILRQGYFQSNGEEYAHYVKLFGPHFKRKAVEQMSDVISSTVLEELAGWRTGELINMTDHLGRLLKKLASRALFKDTDEQAGLHAADMVERHARLARVSAKSILSARFGYSLNTAVHAQAERTYSAIVDWGASRRGLPASRDVLSAIVNAPDEGGGEASPDRIAGYGWILLGAAYDTSTSILSWLFVFLALHPEVADRVYREIVSAPFDVEIDVPALMELPYLDAVIKEALRLIPPAPFQRRKVTTDSDICGCEVASGSQLFLSAWMVNRDSDLYPDPDRFNPDRWQGLKRTSYQWLTFSAGPRRCLGIWFAHAFLKATLANVLLRWRPEIPDGTKIGMKVAVTIRPIPGVPVVLHPQDGNFRRSHIGGSIRKHLRMPN